MNEVTTRFSVPDILCGGCAGSIEKALKGVAGIAAVSVDIAQKTVAVRHDPALASAEAVAVRLDHIGFPATPLA